MKSLLLSIAVLVSATAAQADFGAYQLPITRNGVEQTRIAYNFWSGEYPGPVANVTKKTTLNAYKSLRKLNEPVTCTVKKGIYHPWSNTGNSIINYYTLAEVVSYEAKNDTILEDEVYLTDADFGSDPLNSLKKGDKIINSFYLSEGFCRATLVSGDQKQDIEYFCDAFENSNFVKTATADEFYEQWVYLQCAEGYKAFIEDEALMNSKNVKEGQILGYGEVGE